jgi:hypothetical protein
VAFVDNRRKELELYFRLVATYGASKASNTWRSFVSDGSASVKAASFKEGPPEVAEAVDGDVLEESNGELGVMIARSPSKASLGQDVFMGEMGDILSSKKTELTAAKEAEQDLKGRLASGEEAVNETVADARGKAALEAEAAMHLRSHLSCLEDLGAKLASKKFLYEAKEHSQAELAKRFEDKLSLVSESAEKAEAKLEASRRACIEAAAKKASRVEAAMANQVQAETANMAAVAGHAAMKATVTVLADRTKSRLNELRAAEAKNDILTKAQKTLLAESAEAETLRCKAESEATTAVAALTSHKRDTALRHNAHEAEVRRAEECAANLSALRDIQTRGQLMEADRDSCKPREDDAAAAAEKAAEALVKAKQEHEEAQTEDAQTLGALEAVAGKATNMLDRRVTAVKALAGRLEQIKAELQNSSSKLSAAKAMHKAVEHEFSSLKQRVEGLLAAPLPECASKLEEARKAVVAAGSEGATENANMQRAEQADIQMLKSHRAEEESLVKALDEARTSAAENKEDAAYFREEGAYLSTELDFLVKSSAERCAVRAKQAQELADDYKAALAEALAAKGEVEAMELAMQRSPALSHISSDLGDDLETSTTAKDEIQEKRKARKALKHFKALEQTAQEIGKDSEVAAAALVAAQQELASLQEKQRVTPHPIKRLVRDELAMVNAELQSRKDRESVSLADAQQQMSEWMKQRETLSADLHRMELEVNVAQQNVQATKAMARSCLL